MGPSTLEGALAKMKGFGVKIGFPDTWLDYSALAVMRGRHLENVLRGAHPLQPAAKLVTTS